MKVKAKIEKINISAMVPGLFLPGDPHTVKTIRKRMNQRLDFIAFEQYWYLGKPDDSHQGALELRFEGSRFVKLTITHMYSVSVLPYPIYPYSREDGEMESRRADLSEQTPWKDLIGARLVGVEALVKPNIGFGYQAGVCGVLLRFSNGLSLGYENWVGNSGNFCVEPAGGVWAEGQRLEWFRTL